MTALDMVTFNLELAQAEMHACLKKFDEMEEAHKDLTDALERLHQNVKDMKEYFE